MKASARLRNLRTSPRKVRMIASLITGKDVAGALAELEMRPEKPAKHVKKLLSSAFANAKNLSGNNLSQADVLVLSCIVNGGPTLKRYRPRSRGTANPIMKRTSHISITLELPDTAKRARRKSAAPPPKEISLDDKGAEDKKPLEGGKDENTFRQENKRKIKAPVFAKRFFQRKAV